MFSLIIIIYTAVDCCTLIQAELGTILFYLKKKKKTLIFFYRFKKKNYIEIHEYITTDLYVSFECSEMHEYITTDL